MKDLFYQSLLFKFLDSVIAEIILSFRFHRVGGSYSDAIHHGLVHQLSQRFSPGESQDTAASSIRNTTMIEMANQSILSRHEFLISHCSLIFAQLYVCHKSGKRNSVQSIRPRCYHRISFSNGGLSGTRTDVDTKYRPSLASLPNLSFIRLLKMYFQYPQMITRTSEPPLTYSMRIIVCNIQRICAKYLL